MNIPMESGPNGSGFAGYVPGPSMPTVAFQAGHDQPTVQISPLYGLPKFTAHVSQVAIPGTVGAFAQVVLGVAGRVG